MVKRVKEKKFKKLVSVKKDREEINKFIYKKEVVNRYLVYLYNKF
jgi:hypothetical protein